jgi:DNA-binding response OmpR family regulator
MDHTDGQSQDGTETDRAIRRVLIVEPDRLTRWALEEYLHDRCDVASAEGATAAHSLLNGEPFDALVIANDLPEGDPREVERHARVGNPHITAVRTVTHLPDDAEQTASSAAYLEKPFELSALAQLLGFA